MEPGYSQPQFNAERAPQSGEYSPVSPETFPTVSPEQITNPVERASQSQNTAPAVSAPLMPQLPSPVVAPQSTNESNDSAQMLTNIPSVAADDDLIEKEWVDKAKHIINETSSDPHRREAAISQLQREYLKKRYGKELGAGE